MSDYSVDGNQNAGASVTILSISVSTAGPRLKIFYLTIGAADTPADQANNMQLNRLTADGTGTGVTPQALDPAEIASRANGLENHSAEPTYTAGAVLLSFSFNSRANYQFYANPGRELIAPATISNGLGLRFVVATGTQLHESTIHFAE